jgi:hypothetical protein
MIFAPRYSRHERSVVGRLRLLGLDGERSVTPRHGFTAELRDQLVAEAQDGSACGEHGGRALAAC